MKGLSKERYFIETTFQRIEWTVTTDKQEDTRKAVFYVLEPDYHAHPWTACTVDCTPYGEKITVYAQTEYEPMHADALSKALTLAVRWAEGKKLKGKKIAASKKEPAVLSQ